MPDTPLECKYISYIYNIYIFRKFTERLQCDAMNGKCIQRVYCKTERSATMVDVIRIRGIVPRTRCVQNSCTRAMRCEASARDKYLKPSGMMDPGNIACKIVCVQVIRCELSIERIFFFLHQSQLQLL